jgi:hypothetical protein
MYSPDTRRIGCLRKERCNYAHPGHPAWKTLPVNRALLERRHLRPVSNVGGRNDRRGIELRSTSIVERNGRRPTPESLKMARSRQEPRPDTQPVRQPIPGPSSGPSPLSTLKESQKRPPSPRSLTETLRRHSRQSSSTTTEKDACLPDSRKTLVPSKMEVDQPNPSPFQTNNIIAPPPDHATVVGGMLELLQEDNSPEMMR